MDNIIKNVERIEKLPVFFIVSIGRSGSALLRTLLDAHPNIAIPFLSEFIQFLYYRYHSIQKWDEKQILSFYNDLLELKKTDHLNFDKNKLKDDLLDVNKYHNSQITFTLLCKIVSLNFISVYKKNTIHFIGAKISIYLQLLVLALFPNAKLIYLTRDYRDNILSFLNFKTSQELKMVTSLAYSWKSNNQCVMRFKHKYPEQVYTIKYENLVTDTELYMKEICRFIGIDYYSQMLNYYPKVLEYKKINMDFSHHSSLFSGTINPTKVNNWTSKMKKFDVMIADFVVGNFAEKMNYKRVYTQKNIFLYFFVVFVISYVWCYVTIRYFWREILKKNICQKYLGFQIQNNRDY